MAELPILYSFRRCPYAMRGRMALCLSGTDVRVREILLRDKPDAMLAASEKGTVPVLVMPDGSVIDESLDVMMWAFSANDPFGVWPDDQASRDRALALIATNDGDFKHHLDRYKYSTRYENADAEDHRTAGATVLWSLEAQLAAAPNLMGEQPHLADIAIFPFVRQFRIADPVWFDAQDWTALKTWLARWIGSALFASIMEKFPLWKDTGHEASLLPLLSQPFAPTAASEG